MARDGEEKQRSLAAVLEAEFPTVIAGCHRKNRLIDDAQVAEKHDQLCDLFEATLTFLGAVLARAYLHDGAFAPRVNQCFANFARPSLGHWNEMIHEILAAYEQRENSPLMSSARHMYFKTTDIRREVHEAYRGIGERLPGKPPLLRHGHKDFVELMVSYRNKCWKGHGAKTSAEEYGARTALLLPGLEAWIASLSFLNAYRLVFVNEVRYEQDRFHATCLQLAGINPEPFKFSVPWKIEARQLYLLFANQEGELEYALSLAPLLIQANCTSCGRSESFFLNELKGKRLEYLSYTCGPANWSFIPTSTASSRVAA